MDINQHAPVTAHEQIHIAADVQMDIQWLAVFRVPRGRHTPSSAHPQASPILRSWPSE